MQEVNTSFFVLRGPSSKAVQLFSCAAFFHFLRILHGSICMELRLIALMVMLSVLTSYRSFASLENKSIWNGYNNPFRMDSNFIATFDKLPLEGELANKQLAWPGSYWPHHKGSIAWRWNSSSQSYYYRSPSIREAQTMSNDEISQLSPAEKYDLLMGRDDYPTVKKMWSMTSPRSPQWYGICHGVAPASIHHEEPSPVTLISKDDIEIPFLTSDIKALLANYYARETTSGIIQIGKRCYVSWFGSACRDVNAGAFHIILTNKLGINQASFIADLDRGRQVWNHVPVSYQSKVVAFDNHKYLSSKYAVSSLEVQTSVKYTASIMPHSTPIIGTGSAEYYDKNYHYLLELNSYGEIVGGSWLSWQRPDFIWYQAKESFNGYWQGLNKLLQKQ